MKRLVEIRSCKLKPGATGRVLRFGRVAQGAARIHHRADRELLEHGVVAVARLHRRLATLSVGEVITATGI